MICKDIHTALAGLAVRYAEGQVVIVADEKAIDQLPLTNYQLPILRLSVSEEVKSIEMVSRIWDFLIEQRINRRGLLVCIGGGVLTDIGGFAAATYKRGIDYVNVPTTLLAMTDASTGGKTGVNYGGIKNMIGVFAPPVETLICQEWLKTLPAREFLSGFGEMLKTGLADNGQCLWSRLLNYDLDKMDIEELTPLIADCVAVKERIVAADPKEQGLRKVLNFGHTFGHALEEISLTGEADLTVQRSNSAVVQQRSGLLHGFAVVYGMIAELYLSVVKLGCPKEPLQQLTQLMLHYYGRPECKCSNREQLITLMQLDKKNERAAEINCTLLNNIGSPLVNQIITPDEAKEALEYLFSL